MNKQESFILEVAKQMEEAAGREKIKAVIDLIRLEKEGNGYIAGNPGIDYCVNRLEELGLLKDPRQVVQDALEKVQSDHRR